MNTETQICLGLSLSRAQRGLGDLWTPKWLGGRSGRAGESALPTSRQVMLPVPGPHRQSGGRGVWAFNFRKLSLRYQHCRAPARCRAAADRPGVVGRTATIPPPPGCLARAGTLRLRGRTSAGAERDGRSGVSNPRLCDAGEGPAGSEFQTRLQTRPWGLRRRSPGRAGTEGRPAGGTSGLGGRPRVRGERRAWSPALSRRPLRGGGAEGRGHEPGACSRSGSRSRPRSCPRGELTGAKTG